MKRRYLWWIGGLLVVVIGLVALKKGGVIGKQEGTKVSAEKSEVRTITELVTASGKVYPEVEVKVSSDVSGEITELNVSEGDSVSKGAMLAKIYADIYSSSLDEQAARVNQQEAQVRNNVASLEAVRARMDQAKRQFDRQKQLFEDKVISRLEFEQAENNYQTAVADYNAGQQGISVQRAAVASTRAGLSRAQQDLARTSIRSPMNGVVTILAVKKGERVVGTAQMAGTEMMRIADLRVMEVRVEVGENDIPKISLGDTAVVTIDAYNDRKFKGLVSQVENPLNSTTASTNSQVNTNDVTNYIVHIRLDPTSYQDLIDPKQPKKFPFRPGMSASADIQTRTKAGVVSVPMNAVTVRDKNDTGTVAKKTEPSAPANNNNNDQGGDNNNRNPDDQVTVVFVLKADGTVERRTVKPGIQDLNHIEIGEGLKPGEQVITGPYTVVSKTLRNGMKVNVVPKDQLFETKK